MNLLTMTQEDKALLFKDLCSRLPYGVKIEGYKLPYIVLNSDWLHFMYTYQEFAIRRPYLRPMSSMTFGEWEEMTALIYPHGRVNRNPDNKNELLLWLSVEGNDMPIILMDNVFSWLNSHHFDYRGLIPMGLALEAPEGMYDKL